MKARLWLSAALLLVAAVACELNPQPEPPLNTGQIGNVSGAGGTAGATAGSAGASDGSNENPDYAAGGTSNAGGATGAGEANNPPVVVGDADLDAGDAAAGDRDQ
jgi:hypothetical protein